MFNTEHLSAMFERVIIATGSSNRQTKALASSVRESVKGRGFPVLSTEGEDNGEWIIVDCGAAVVHLMQPSIRVYYNLEEIWGGKNVRVKFGEVKTGLVKASEPSGGAVTRAGAKRPAGPAPIGKLAVAALKKPSTTGAGKTAGAAARAAARAAAPKLSPREATAKKVANRTAAGKRVATKAPVRKTAAPLKTVVVKPAGKPAGKAPVKAAAKSPTRPAAKKKPVAR